MKIERKNMRGNLPKKGFQEEKDKHHIYFHHHFNGAATGVYTYVSHSKKISYYSGHLLTQVRKQLKLDSNKQVVDLVDCPMDEDQYNNILKEKGFIPDTE